MDVIYGSPPIRSPGAFSGSACSAQPQTSSKAPSGSVPLLNTLIVPFSKVPYWAREHVLPGGVVAAKMVC